jgi:hypothetical protein
MSTPTSSLPDSISMARSPIFFTARNNSVSGDTLEFMSLNMLIYSGAFTTSGTDNYELEKNYSINNVINFEVSDLIRSEFYHDFSVWDDIGFTQGPQGEALWVWGYGDWTYDNAGGGAVSAQWNQPDEEAPDQFIVLDGWATRDNIAPVAVSQVVLATSRDRQVLVGNHESLAINNSVANDLGAIRITWQSGDTELLTNAGGSTAPPDSSTNNSQDLVIYAGVGPANLENNGDLPPDIKPSSQTDGGVGQYYDVILLDKEDAQNEIGRVRYYVICEPKYDPVQVAFINRFGVADFITFFKRSDTRGNFTQDSYQKSIYNDGFTTPSLEVGKYQSFNLNSRNTLTLNTGFVDQDYDETIEDILMSEYVAVYTNSNWVSAVPNRGSIEYQKNVNTKLINYTMSFDFGFDERSLVR